MSSDVIEDVCAHKLSIDCHKLTIRERGEGLKTTYEGCGTITQAPDGPLTVKAFVTPPPGCTIADRFNVMFSRAQSVRAGEIIPDGEYYELTAHSFDGPIWICDRFLPKFRTSFSTGGMIAYGDLWQLKSMDTGPVVNKGEQLTLRYRNRPEFPCNVATKTETTAGERKGWSHSWNVARFSAAGFEFTAETNEQGMLVCAWTDSGTLPEHLESRISEALAFVFGAEFTPFAISRSGTESRDVRIFSEAGAPEKGSYPPIQCAVNDPQGFFWRLFDRYLTHICKHQTDHWHPLSSHVIAVIRATEGSLDAQALTLGIAVEGVLKCAYPAIGQPSAEDIAQANAALALIKNSALKDKFKDRMKGLISATKSARPKDKLHALATYDVVRQELIPTWKRLRDSYAHADLSDPNGVAERYRDCLIVRTLLHELIFGAIGYEGEYTDYSVVGWPLAKSERPCLARGPTDDNGQINSYKKQDQEVTWLR